MRRYFLILFAFSVLVGAVVFVLSGFIPGKYLSSLYPFIITFYFAESLVVHKMIHKSVSKKASRFVNYFIMITGIKLMLYLVIMLVFAVLYKEKSMAFILTFFAMYLIFTPLQVKDSLRLAKGSREKNGKDQ